MRPKRDRSRAEAATWRASFGTRSSTTAASLARRSSSTRGDRIRLSLVNRLDEATNLHTHGFHVSPEGNSDNVLLHIGPAETFDFQFDLPPNHAQG